MCGSVRPAQCGALLWLLLAAAPRLAAALPDGVPSLVRREGREASRLTIPDDDDSETSPGGDGIADGATELAKEVLENLKVSSQASGDRTTTDSPSQDSDEVTTQVINDQSISSPLDNENPEQVNDLVAKAEEGITNQASGDRTTTDSPSQDSDEDTTQVPGDHTTTASPSQDSDEDTTQDDSESLNALVTRRCEVFHSTKFLAENSESEIHDFQISPTRNYSYGEIQKNREECFNLCRRADICQQVVFDRQTSACYPMRFLTKHEAEKTNRPPDADFDTALCGVPACRIFDNYRQGGTGMPLDRDSAQHDMRRLTKIYAHEVLVPKPPVPPPDGAHSGHVTPFKAHAFEVGSYSECEGACLKNGLCEQVAFDKKDMLCELWTGRSHGVDADGWPGKNMGYKSASCGSRVCIEFPNTRKSSPGAYRPLRLNVSETVKYGGEVETWAECLSACQNDYRCLQTVWKSSHGTGTCFPLAAAIAHEAKSAAGFSLALRRFRRRRLPPATYTSAHCFLAHESYNAVL